MVNVQREMCAKTLARVAEFPLILLRDATGLDKTTYGNAWLGSDCGREAMIAQLASSAVRPQRATLKSFEPALSAWALQINSSHLPDTREPGLDFRCKCGRNGQCLLAEDLQQ